MYIFWLYWVFVAARGLFSSCCEQASHCSSFSYCGAQVLCSQASVVVAHRLETIHVMWTLPRPEIGPVSLALAGEFLSTVSSGK